MATAVLVLNCGSSSLKAALLDGSGRRLTGLEIEGLGLRPRLRIGGESREVDAAGPAAAVRLALDELAARGAPPGAYAAVGHRIVHGGERFTAPVAIDDAVAAELAALGPLAPLHNPPALEGLAAARERLPALPHVAVFDTAFHATLPRRAREYALPRELAARLGLRRYGFHGTSHAHVAGVAAGWLRRPLEELRLVTCHLGAGASVTAVEFGRSVETSMGYTPLEGLVMATRSGDLDPGVVLALLREGRSVEELDRLLNRESGLVGLAGTADMREVEARARAGDDGCRLALQVYAHRARKYVGAYAAVMGGVDAIVFTAGVGQNSALLRSRIAQRLEFLGALLDDDRNRDARVGTEQPVAEISAPESRCRLLVVATDEEAAIAAAVRRLIGGHHAVKSGARIPIAVSGRHVHLTRASVEALFGPGHVLGHAREISQPGQFAAAETVTLVGPHGRIEHVRIVGPERQADQVEISRTDEFVLGVDAPVRESGDLAHTPGIRIEGPRGVVTTAGGVICALRHIHMTTRDAAALGVEDGDDVDVRVDCGGRSLTFGAVRVRVRDDYRLEMHVDTDEANAAGIGPGSEGVLEAVEASARVVRRD
ncbi:MAG: acetate/propionate family kinase [Proteobacteria bacterium]|nr:acetate/propionate family kinase [Pseudomonadota bacterium]